MTETFRYDGVVYTQETPTRFVANKWRTPTLVVEFSRDRWLACALNGSNSSTGESPVTREQAIETLKETHRAVYVLVRAAIVAVQNGGEEPATADCDDAPTDVPLSCPCGYPPERIEIASLHAVECSRCGRHSHWFDNELAASADWVVRAIRGEGEDRSPGTKHDHGKPRWDLLPWRELGSIVDVLTYGAEKYGADNWQRVENPRSRYFAALMRHVVAWSCGERVDTESGLPHLAHAATNVLFLMWGDNESAARDGGGVP